jgi:aminopeptidase C
VISFSSSVFPLTLASVSSGEQILPDEDQGPDTRHCALQESLLTSNVAVDLELIDYELGFNIDMLGLNKAQRLQVGESSMTHAMVLTAVHVDGHGRPVRWRVQNSWGEEVGDKGFFVMSDRWMDEFVYQAVIVSGLPD